MDMSTECCNFWIQTMTICTMCWPCLAYSLFWTRWCYAIFMTVSTGSNEHDHRWSNFDNNATAMFEPCWIMTMNVSVISRTESNWIWIFHLLFSILRPYQGIFFTKLGQCLIYIHFKVLITLSYNSIKMSYFYLHYDHVKACYGHQII